MDVLTQLRESRLEVRALARNPARLAESGLPPGDIAMGDVLNPASLEAACDSADLVISVLGTPLTRKPVTLLSTGTRNLVEAMKHKGVRRILCVTGVGAGDSRGHGGFLYDRLILPLLLRTIYEDKDRQEDVLRQSGLDWTIVRPAQLSDGPLTGVYREITQFGNDRLTKISRKDVAHFLVREALENRFIGKSVNLTQ